MVDCDLADSGYFGGHDRVLTLTGDVADPRLAQGAVNLAADRFGPPGILVNDAASDPDGRLLELAPADWDRVFAVNVTGSFQFMQAFARHAVNAGTAGAIVSISSGSARSPRPSDEPSVTAAVRHIQAVLQGDAEPQRLAIQTSLAMARALHDLAAAAAAGNTAAAG